MSPTRSATCPYNAHTCGHNARNAANRAVSDTVADHSDRNTDTASPSNTTPGEMGTPGGGGTAEPSPMPVLMVESLPATSISHKHYDECLQGTQAAWIGSPETLTSTTDNNE